VCECLLGDLAGHIQDLAKTLCAVDRAVEHPDARRPDNARTTKPGVVDVFRVAGRLE